MIFSGGIWLISETHNIGVNSDVSVPLRSSGDGIAFNVEGISSTGGIGQTTSSVSEGACENIVLKVCCVGGWGGGL